VTVATLSTQEVPLRPTIRQDRAQGVETPRECGELGRGATLGRYIVVERLGAGGMGVVYAAFDPELSRKVAIKLIRGGATGASATRLLREARAMARLTHPNVIAVHDVGEIAGQVFVAMEFVEGPTLRAWQERTPRPWREVVEVYLQAGRGLAAAHRAGLVHRDFKPEYRRPSPNAPQTPAGSQSHVLGRFERVRGTRVVPE